MWKQFKNRQAKLRGPKYLPAIVNIELTGMFNTHLLLP